MAKGQRRQIPALLKRKRFVQAYTSDEAWLNGTKAAKIAGYAASCAHVNASVLLSDPVVFAEIDRRLQQFAMSSGECLSRLTAWARADMIPFLTVEGYIDLTTSEARANIGLIRKCKQRRIYRQQGKDQLLEVVTEVELHDAKDAVKELLAVHGAYAPEKVDLTSKGRVIGEVHVYQLPDNGRGGNTAPRWNSGDGNHQRKKKRSARANT